MLLLSHIFGRADQIFGNNFSENVNFLLFEVATRENFSNSIAYLDLNGQIFPCSNPSLDESKFIFFDE